MKKISNRMLILAAAYCFLVGGGLLMYSSWSNDPVIEAPTEVEVAPQEPEQQAVSQEPNAVVAKAEPSNPVHLQVLEADIDIPVAIGVYNRQSQTWTLSKDKAHFATMTAKPNQKEGNTFIYGHNRKSVFSRLVGVKPGTTAVVTTATNDRYVYRMRTSYTTSPTDDSVLRYTGAPILTLQTCTGAMFQNRTMYVFDLVGVTHA